MQRVLLQLPVPPYLKKILDRKYGNEFRAKENNLLGMTVLNTLQRKSDRNYQYSRNQYTDGNFRFKDRSEMFFIYVGLDKAMRKGFHFTPERAYQIVKALDKQIREDLYISAITNKEHYGIEYQTTICNFLDLYDINDEEMSYESLRKDFNRNRKRLTEQLKINV